MANKKIIDETVNDIKENLKSNPVKKDLQKYLKSTLAIIEEIQSQQFDPRKEQEEKEKSEVIENAQQIITTGNNNTNQSIMEVLGSMFDMVDIFKQKYNSQVDLFNESTEKYESILKAIKIEEDRLTELFEIEKALLNLAVVEKTQQKRQSDLLDEYKNKGTELKEKHEQSIQEYKISLDNAKKDHKITLAELKKERDRNEEQYQYDLTLAHKKQKNELEEELKQLEKETKEQLKEKSEELEKWESELGVKEVDLSTKEDYITGLEEQVESIPQLEELARQDGVEKATEKSKKSFEYERTILKGSYSAKIELLESQLEAEKAKVAELKEEIATIKEERKEAIDKVSDMANNITNAGNAKKSQEYTESLLREISKKDSGK